jgi:hypothetical protein
MIIRVLSADFQNRRTSGTNRHAAAACAVISFFYDIRADQKAGKLPPASGRSRRPDFRVASDFSGEFFQSALQRFNRLSAGFQIQFIRNGAVLLHEHKVRADGTDVDP